MRFDLVRILHLIWLDVAEDRIKDALIFIEELGRYVQMSALGLEDEIDAEVDRTHATRRDLQTLQSEDFDDELRRLYEEGKEQ